MIIISVNNIIKTYISKEITAFTMACCFLVPQSHLADTAIKEIKIPISITFNKISITKLNPEVIFLCAIIINATIGKSINIEALIILCITIYLLIDKIIIYICIMSNILYGCIFIEMLSNFFRAFSTDFIKNFYSMGTLNEKHKYCKPIFNIY